MRLHIAACSIHYTKQEKVFLSEAIKHGPGTSSAISEMETFNYLTAITYTKINPGPLKKAPLQRQDNHLCPPTPGKSVL